MTTTIKTFEYNNSVIEFDMQPNSVMVNATEMAKIFGKQVQGFLRNEDVKNFITECLNNANSRYLNIEKEEDLVISKQNSGTWMHRILALKFAAWLNPTFELWVYFTIDDLLFGKYRELEEQLKKSADRKNRIEELKKTLCASDDFIELERLQLEERQSAYRRGKVVANQLNMLRGFGYAEN